MPKANSHVAKSKGFLNESSSVVTFILFLYTNLNEHSIGQDFKLKTIRFPLDVSKLHTLLCSKIFLQIVHMNNSPYNLIVTC